MKIQGATAGEPPAPRLVELRVVAADGTGLHLEGNPAGRNLLMLHGLGYASWAARALRAALAPRGIGLWSLDHRGTGESEPGALPISIELLAEDAAAAIAALPAPVDLLGYSMGGYAAQTLVREHPGSASRVILLGTSAGGAGSVPVPEATRRAWLDAAGSAPPEYARRTMPLSFREGWPEAHPEEYERVLAARLERPTPSEVWRAQYEACERFLGAGIDDTGLSLPVLVAHGTADRVLPVENGRAIHRMLPRARYIEVAGGGHLLHIESADLIAEHIDSFLTHTRQGIAKESSCRPSK